jgi:hypothetical protein
VLSAPASSAVARALLSVVLVRRAPACCPHVQHTCLMMLRRRRLITSRQPVSQTNANFTFSALRLSASHLVLVGISNDEFSLLQSRGRMRFSLRNSFGGEDFNIFMSVSLLCYTISYNTGYCFRSIILPGHLLS